MPFPPLSWWQCVANAATVIWDGHEHYQKMSRRSRYRIATAAGPAQLSVPLLGGRDQRAAMSAIFIDNRQPWQRTHWRTLTSAYRRAPFFEHFEESLKELFERPFVRLADFNLASVHWLKAALGFAFAEQAALRFEPIFTGGTDLRDEVLSKSEAAADHRPYTQVFADRHAFIPNLSALDALFAGGPACGLFTS